MSQQSGRFKATASLVKSTQLQACVWSEAHYSPYKDKVGNGDG